jgi:hypothetical protein
VLQGTIGKHQFRPAGAAIRVVFHELHKGIDGPFAQHRIWVEHQEILARRTCERNVVIPAEGITAVSLNYFNPRIPIPHNLRGVVRGAVIHQDYLQRIVLGAGRHGIQALRDKFAMIVSNDPDQDFCGFSSSHLCSFVTIATVRSAISAAHLTQ